MNFNVNGTSSEYWKIVHIPEKPPVLPHLQHTVNVLVTEIEPRHAHALVRRLNSIAPLESLRHVKRIRKKCLDGGQSQLFLILCMASENDGEPDSMPEGIMELVNMYQLSTFTSKVCKYAASTKEEWDEQCKLWPTSFHPPTYNIDGITGFSEEDSFSVFNFMKLAVQMAKSGISVVNAAVIVDPLTKEVIASSRDQVISCTAPMNNTCSETSCMAPVETTMHYNASEMENDENVLSPQKPYKNVSCLHPWSWVEKGLNMHTEDSWHPLRHAAIVAIENSAARDMCLFPVKEHSADFGQEDDKMSSPTESPLKGHKNNTDVKDDNTINCIGNNVRCNLDRPYLCTGYDIYFVWEPCIMCAMAIVHQRIRRVFYAFSNENNGALGSVHRLQGERSLNHHYAVFRVFIPPDILDESSSSNFLD